MISIAADDLFRRAVGDDMAVINLDDTVAILEVFRHQHPDLIFLQQDFSFSSRKHYSANLAV